MTDILIDNISNEVLENLRIKAKLRGMLLEDFARELIEAEGAAFMEKMRRAGGVAPAQGPSLGKTELRES
jgi:plasmid stability protein